MVTCITFGLKRSIIVALAFGGFMVLGSIPTSVRGQSDTTTNQNQAPKTRLSGTAYLEPYFAYDFNKPSSKDLPYLYNYSRHNEFNLNLAFFSGTYEDDRVRGTIALQAGSYPMANYAAEPQLFQHIYQASAGVQVIPNLWIDAGVFPSHFGIETAVGKDQWTLTRSLVAENTPYSETGVHASYLTGAWTLGLFVLNGWQNIRDQNSNKAVGTQLQYSAGILTLNSSTFFGNEKPDSTPRNRIFHDLYAIVQISKVFSVSGVFDIGWEQTPISGSYARWDGTSLIVRALIVPTFAVAARGEYYHDPQQVIIATGTPNGYETMGFSVNCDYIFSEEATFRLEGKYYSSKDAIFIRDNTPIANSMIITTSLAVSF